MELLIAIHFDDVIAPLLSGNKAPDANEHSLIEKMFRVLILLRQKGVDIRVYTTEHTVDEVRDTFLAYAPSLLGKDRVEIVTSSPKLSVIHKLLDSHNKQHPGDEISTDLAKTNLFVLDSNPEFVKYISNHPTQPLTGILVNNTSHSHRILLERFYNDLHRMIQDDLQQQITVINDLKKSCELELNMDQKLLKARREKLVSEIYSNFLESLFDHFNSVPKYKTFVRRVAILEKPEKVFLLKLVIITGLGLYLETEARNTLVSVLQTNEREKKTIYLGVSNNMPLDVMLLIACLRVGNSA